MKFRFNPDMEITIKIMNKIFNSKIIKIKLRSKIQLY